MDKLKRLGYEFLQPGVGLLACGDFGAGKMAEPADIVKYVINSFVKKDLIGRKIVITAGPTIEPLDPVRYITNHSSGKMEARSRGAEVVLISGPTALEPPVGVTVVNVNTTIDMFEAVGRYFDNCDILIKSAAPADYRPENTSLTKIKKREGENDELNIKFVRNPDIANHFGNKKSNQIVIGFAAETDNLIEYAKNKLINKNFDFIIANDITKEGAGFKSDTNIVTIIDNKDNVESYPIMSKNDLAKIILDKANYVFKNKS